MTELAPCGITGKDDEVLTIATFNRWFQVFLVKHHARLSDIQSSQEKLHNAVDEQILKADVVSSKLEGGVKVLLWMLPLVSLLISALLAVVLFLAKEVYNKVEVGILPVAKERIERHAGEIDEVKRRISALEKK